MLNYANLNPEDFEALCRDIMERKLGVALRCFGPGKDGGIDILDEFSESMLSVNPEDGTTHMDASDRIVIQAKHYFNSPASSLISALENELLKVKRLNPSQYYVCCSNALLPQHVAKIFEIFKDYMADSANIISQNELEKFFSDPANDDILRKNYKLWFSSPRVQEMLASNASQLYCDEVLEDIQEDLNIFVETEAFRQAYRALQEQRILCITGDPGTGKSMTSRMLTARYIAQGYRLRAAKRVSDLPRLLDSLSPAPDEKEIIYLDDCFGQIYFNVDFEQAGDILTLISHVKRHPQKFMILNSRITVLNEAQEQLPKLVRCLERGSLQFYRIDMNQSPESDRARILYSHLHRRNLPQAYIDEITKDQRYWDIIRHSNYNPRILEFVCTPTHYQDIPPEGYYDFIQKCLNNPTEIWKDEYENRLLPVDRILLQTLYSLGDDGSEEKDVQYCFNYRIQDNFRIDKTNDPYIQSLSRLSGSMITFHYEDSIKKLAMVNPSVNDFLSARLKTHPTEMDDIRKYICHPNQIGQIIPAKEEEEYIEQLLISSKVDELLFASETEKSSWIANTLATFCMAIPKYKPLLLKELQPATQSKIIPFALFPNYILLCKSYEKLTKFWNCYGLSDFFTKGENLYVQLCANTLTHKESPETYLTHIDTHSVDFICIVDSFFIGSMRSSYITQVRRWLTDFIPHGQIKIDFDRWIKSYDIIDTNFIKSAISSGSVSGATLSKKQANKMKLIASKNFSYAKRSLPNEFQNLPIFQEPPEIEIVFTADDFTKFIEANHTPPHQGTSVAPNSHILDIDALFEDSPH